MDGLPRASRNKSDLNSNFIVTPMLRSTCVLACALILLAAGGCKSMSTAAKINRGSEAYQQGRYVAAADALSEAAEQSPTSWRAQYMLGLTRLKQNKYYDARVALDRAWVLHPETPESRYIVDALAETLLAQNDEEALYAALDRATRMYGSGYDYLRKAVYLQHVGDMDNAALAFEKAGKLTPADDNRAFVQAADFYREMGDREREIVALRRAYQIDPEDLEVANRLRQHGIVPGPTVGLPKS